MVQILFWVFGILMLVAAVISVTRRNPVHSALFLVLVFFLMSGLFFLMEGFLVGTIQILVYAGAIMVLFLFVLMLLNLGDETAEKWVPRGPKVLAALVPLAVFIQLFYIVRNVKADPQTYGQAGGSIEEIGSVLFREYMLPFEVVSILLIVAIVGSVVLSKRELK